ncbi:HHR105Cp [Eremothecium sinecaudum]|uniref:HHR105Cp n=1 Tax=Eremothecium sinecaudum TaxID=45286 RepID=A0A0X8HWM7_9SACH|nr:HHR105Cp [Eremothecium sinecaudum]AMD22874.1 HHR105Cp [Eremothecium sinecaudum]
MEPNRFFIHQDNDSAETIKLEELSIGGAGLHNSNRTVEDGITKCISDLNIYDLLHNNPPSSSDDNEEGHEARIRAAGEVDGLQVLLRPPEPSSAPIGKQHQDISIWAAGGPRHRTPIRKLKSSLKLSSNSHSHSSCNSASLCSNKNVRFAPQLAQVKRFDLNSEPISISSESSPGMAALDQLEELGETVLDKFWFGTPSFGRMKFRMPPSKSVPKFSLDYDSDDSDEKQLDVENADDDYSSFDSSEDECDVEDDFVPNEPADTPDEDISSTVGGTRCVEQLMISHWELQSSNLVPFHSSNVDVPFQEQLLDFLQGHNIKLSKISLTDMHTIKGQIYVTNLNFEKFIEVKFSFNEWKDIHYVSAQYLRTVTPKVDEFNFTIDLSSYKYFMKVKSLLYCDYDAKQTWCPVTMALCCRYDVNGETYYDNNNYENFQINARCLTMCMPPSAKMRTSNKPNSKRKVSLSNCDVPTRKGRNTANLLFGKGHKIMPLTKSFSYDFLLNFKSKSTISPPIAGNTSSVRPSIGRTFSEGTDYFNTSPLKHVYHFDASKSKNKDESSTNSSSNYYDTCMESTTTSKEPTLSLSSDSYDILSSDTSSLSNKDSNSIKNRDNCKLMDNKNDLINGRVLHNYPYYSASSSSTDNYSRYDYREPLLTNALCGSPSSNTEDSEKVTVVAKGG